MLLQIAIAAYQKAKETCNLPIHSGVLATFARIQNRSSKRYLGFSKKKVLEEMDDVMKKTQAGRSFPISKSLTLSNLLSFVCCF